MVDRCSGTGCFLGLGQDFEVAGQGQDVPGQGRWLEPFELGVHRDDRTSADAHVDDSPVVRGRRDIVSLGDLRAVALLEDQLLLGQVVVGEDPVELLDLVEQGVFGGGVVVVVADQLTDPGPVLLLHVRAVVAVARPGPGEGDLLLGTVAQQVVVDELRSVEFLTDVKT